MRTQIKPKHFAEMAVQLIIVSVILAAVKFIFS